MIDSKIEEQFNKFLQQNISIYIEGHKPIKEGILLIFKFKEFYFNFTIKTPTGHKVVELPYPFDIKINDDHAILSYELQEFTRNNDDLDFKLKLFKPEKKNKLYNSIVVLSAIGI